MTTIDLKVLDERMAAQWPPATPGSAGLDLRPAWMQPLGWRPARRR